MTDFDDTLRRAVAGTAARTVAPPFAAVERRARARRNRQVAAVAASAVAVLAGGALAVPRGDARTTGPARPATTSPAPAATATDWLRPYTELHGDTRAHEEIARCLEFRETLPGTRPDKMKASTDWVECHRLAGFAAPPFDPGHVTVHTGPEDSACAAMPARGGDGVRTVASGAATWGRWAVLAWTGMDGARCVGRRVEPATGAWAEEALDSGPPGAPRPVLSLDRLPGEGLPHYLYWGAVPPEVVRVVLTAGEAEADAAPVPAGDRGYVALLHLVTPDQAGSIRFTAYDARGERVALPPPRED